MMKAPFGKFKKTPQQNSSCFLHSAVAFIASRLNPHTANNDSKHAKKFKKYCQRLSCIVAGQYTKIPNSKENLDKIASEFEANHSLLAEILLNLEHFDFEDRKYIEVIINELFNSAP